jgi:hypothetical protein
MQQRLGLAAALAAALALAGEEPGAPTAGEQAQLVALDEAQLAALKGGQDVCVICANVALNVAVSSPGATQAIGNQTISAPGNESAAPGTCRGSAVNLSVLSPGATQRIGAQMINFCRTRLVAARRSLAVDSR